MKVKQVNNFEQLNKVIKMSPCAVVFYYAQSSEFSPEYYEVGNEFSSPRMVWA